MIPKTCSDCIYYDSCGFKCRLTEDHEWSTSGGCEDGEMPLEEVLNKIFDSVEQDDILHDAIEKEKR